MYSSDLLLREMRESFKKCEQFLDIELQDEEPMIPSKELIEAKLDKLIPEQLTMVQEVLDSILAPARQMSVGSDKRTG